MPESQFDVNRDKPRRDELMIKYWNKTITIRELEELLGLFSQLYEHNVRMGNQAEAVSESLFMAALELRRYDMKKQQSPHIENRGFKLWRFNRGAI